MLQKTAGISLLAGSILLTLTMVLHPSGGSPEHILQIRPIIMISHALAILSMPFMAFGLWGLSAALNDKAGITYLSFAVACFALVATMLAGTINGLALPIYLSRIPAEDLHSPGVHAATDYGFSLNTALAYILVAGITLSMLLWSLLILFRQKAFPRWIGGLGIGLTLLGLTGALTGFNFIGVDGLRIFVLGLVSWIISAAIILIRRAETQPEAA